MELPLPSPSNFLKVALMKSLRKSKEPAKPAEPALSEKVAVLTHFDEELLIKLDKVVFEIKTVKRKKFSRTQAIHEAVKQYIEKF